MSLPRTLPLESFDNIKDVSRNCRFAMCVGGDLRISFVQSCLHWNEKKNNNKSVTFYKHTIFNINKKSLLNHHKYNEVNLILKIS